MALLYIILAVLAVLILVILARTLAFRPGEQKEEAPVPVEKEIRGVTSPP